MVKNRKKKPSQGVVEPQGEPQRQEQVQRHQNQQPQSEDGRPKQTEPGIARVQLPPGLGEPVVTPAQGPNPDQGLGQPQPLLGAWAKKSQGTTPPPGQQTVPQSQVREGQPQSGPAKGPRSQRSQDTPSPGPVATKKGRQGQPQSGPSKGPSSQTSQGTPNPGPVATKKGPQGQPQSGPAPKGATSQAHSEGPHGSSLQGQAGTPSKRPQAKPKEPPTEQMSGLNIAQGGGQSEGPEAAKGTDLIKLIWDK
jgi:hypothetical protein